MAKKGKPAAPQSDEELLSGLGITAPPVVAAGAQRRPLGPPTEFYAERGAAIPEMAGFAPFLEGDQWTPAYLPAENRARLQAKMNAAGLYGTQGYQPGIWTNDDANAYQVILESANARGVADPEQALDMFASEQRVTSPRAKAPRAPLVTQYADPESIRQVIRRSAMEMLGQRLSDAEEQKIVASYQAYTAQAQQAEYAATNPEGAGGTYTQPMSAEAYATGQIEATRPKDVGSQRYLDAFGEIVSSLGTVVQPGRTTTGGGVA